MTECEKIQEKISELIDGELSAADETEVRAHIAHCPDCAALYAAFSAVSEAASEPEDVPETLHAAVMDRVRRAEKALRFQRGFRRWRPAAICAAALIVVVGTVFAVGRATLLAPKAPETPGNGAFYVADVPESCLKSAEDVVSEEKSADNVWMDTMGMPQFSLVQQRTPGVLTVRVTGQTEDGTVAEVLSSDWAEAGATVYLYWAGEDTRVPVPGEVVTVQCAWYDAETGECWDTELAAEK